MVMASSLREIRGEVAATARERAETFLAAMAARRVRVWLVGTCLKLSGREYREALTDDHRATIRRDRAAIVDVLLNRGDMPSTVTTVTIDVPVMTDATRRVAPRLPEPQRPSYVDPAVLRIINGNRREEVERRRAETTAVMLAQIGQMYS